MEPRAHRRCRRGPRELPPECGFKDSAKSSREAGRPSTGHCKGRLFQVHGVLLFCVLQLEGQSRRVRIAIVRGEARHWMIDNCRGPRVGSFSASISVKLAFGGAATIMKSRFIGARSWAWRRPRLVRLQSHSNLTPCNRIDLIAAIFLKPRLVSAIVRREQDNRPTGKRLALVLDGAIDT